MCRAVKPSALPLFVFIVFHLLFSSVSEGAPKPEPRPFAIIELFTSEGCSSCPAAEWILGELSDDAEKNGYRIFPMAFHVDYWNALGWKDHFSHPRHSARQRTYAKQFEYRHIYTPQTIVNGRREIPGAQRTKILYAIEKEMLADFKLGLAIYTASFSPLSHRVYYHLSAARPDDVLYIAVVDKQVKSAITAGENKGIVARHRNVVRYFKTHPLDDKTSGSVLLRLPSELEFRKNLAVVAFVQQSDMTIIAADKAALVMERSR